MYLPHTCLLVSFASSVLQLPNEHIALTWDHPPIFILLFDHLVPFCKSTLPPGSSTYHHIEQH